MHPCCFHTVNRYQQNNPIRSKVGGSFFSPHDNNVGFDFADDNAVLHTHPQTCKKSFGTAPTTPLLRHWIILSHHISYQQQLSKLDTTLLSTLYMAKYGGKHGRSKWCVGFRMVLFCNVQIHPQGQSFFPIDVWERGEGRAMCVKKCLRLDDR
jgi:hypothetical protein